MCAGTDTLPTPPTLKGDVVFTAELSENVGRCAASYDTPLPCALGTDRLRCSPTVCDTAHKAHDVRTRRTL